MSVGLGRGDGNVTESDETGVTGEQETLYAKGLGKLGRVLVGVRVGT